MKKKYDLAVKVGEYNKDGQTKSRYQNVGALMDGPNGEFILINKTFNPAGVPSLPDSDKIVISLFASKEGFTRVDSSSNDDIPF